MEHNYQTSLRCTGLYDFIFEIILSSEMPSEMVPCTDSLNADVSA